MRLYGIKACAFYDVRAIEALPPAITVRLSCD